LQQRALGDEGPSVAKWGKRRQQQRRRYPDYRAQCFTVGHQGYQGCLSSLTRHIPIKIPAVIIIRGARASASRKRLWLILNYHFSSYIMPTCVYHNRAVFCSCRERGHQDHHCQHPTHSVQQTKPVLIYLLRLVGDVRLVGKALQSLPVVGARGGSRSRRAQCLARYLFGFVKDA
jgi:hypothetical protein